MGGTLNEGGDPARSRSALGRPPADSRARPTEASVASFRASNTNYYLVPATDGDFLAFDAGWPGDFLGYARSAKAAGFGFERVKWAMVSHFHLDHAGLVGEFQHRGISCLVFGDQAKSIDSMEELIHRKYEGYRDIDRGRLVHVEVENSRASLAALGIAGEVIRTSGHSEDGIALLLDSGEAMIGDLYPLSQVMADDRASLEDWRRIREHGSRIALPAHAPPFAVDISS